MDQKEGEGEEVREEKKLKESLQIYVYRFERRNTARSSGATPQERREKSATSGKTSGDVDTAVASC